MATSLVCRAAKADFNNFVGTFIKNQFQSHRSNSVNRTPIGPKSFAISRVKATRAALDVAYAAQR